MSDQTYSIIIQTISEMISVGLSKSFIKKEIPLMFEVNLEESFWKEIFSNK